ncbi:Uncharacterized mitochondrial protein AtMg00310 [Linum perenne]
MIRRMNSLLRRFFWSRSMTKNTIHWCKGEKLCDPLREGGLGFKDFGLFNKALLARQGWRILNQPESIWVRLLKSLYFPKGDFLTASKGRRPSWIWPSLIDGRSALDLGCIRVIGNGKNTDFFSDPWIPSFPGFRLTPEPGIQLLAEGVMDRDSRSWDATTVRSFCSPTETEAILRVPIGPSNFDDFWPWSADPTGRFSVRSAYHVLRSNRSNSPSMWMQLPKRVGNGFGACPFPRKLLSSFGEGSTIA